MPTSVPGNSRQLPRRARGFTLIEVLLVLAIIAVSVGLVSVALRDSTAARLEEEGARLAALLEMARAEARVAGAAVYWVPGHTDDGRDWRFVGLGAAQALPVRWLDPATQAQVVGTTAVMLGPDAILPAQRIVLRLGEQKLELSSDGLAPFAVADAASAAAPR
jgi:general secretion pathway protein H